MESSEGERPAGPWRLAVLSLILAAAPFLGVTFVPCTDLPQHLAQVRMLEELWGLAPATIDLSNVSAHPLGANTLVYWPLWLLSWLFGPVTGGKLCVLSLSMGTAAALHVLALRRERDPLHAVAAGMLFFTAALYWGFLNFLSGLPIFLLLLAFCLPEEPAPPISLSQAVIAAGLLALLYFAHVLWLPCAAIAVLSAELPRADRKKRLALWAACAAPVGLAALAWFGALVGARGAAGFRTGVAYLTSLSARLEPRWAADALLGGVRGFLEPAFLVILAMYVVLSILRGRKLGTRAADRTLLWTGACLVTFAWLGPDVYANTLLLNERFLPVGSMLLLLALPPVASKLLRGSMLAAACLFALGLCVAWALFEQEELSGLPEALASSPAPKSMVGLDYRHQSLVLRGYPFLQTFAYFQALRGGEVSFSFAEHGSGIVRQNAPKLHPWTPALEWYAERVTREDLAAFDCALVNGEPQIHAEFAQRWRLTTRQQDGHFRLYCRESAQGGSR
jgi:hypothetical protein